jgi:threonine dehydrogenase-like Zn-dependent dehydrogenase
MKAVVFRKGKGLVCEEVPIPQIDSNQVLVKVINTGFCGSDHSLIETEGIPDGIILGHEVSGIVEAVGSKVQGMAEGTKVIIRPTFCGSCVGCRIGKPQLCSGNRRSIGIGDLPGGFAEYLKVFPQMLIPIPPGVDSQNAALAELFAVALHAVNVVGRKKGSALVIGAGAVGLALVKVLKILEFNPIVVSEPVAMKRELAKRFGADQTVDPLSEDLLAVAFCQTTTAGFESVFECAGLHGMLATAMNVTGPGGIVCQLSVIYREVSINPAVMMFKEIKLTGSYGNTHQENIRCLSWMAERQLDARPIISDRIALEQLPAVYQEKIHTGKAIKVLLQIGDEF